MKRSEVTSIEIRGARVNNLKNISLDIPLNKLVCFAGPSGSGKTSLAFHTLLTESKRRFVNSFPNSMKFFTERPAPVDVDRIFPVLPVFGLPQINPVVGSRAVVSDVMRLTDSLQNLFFSFSKELCPQHDCELEVRSVTDQLKSQAPKNQEGVFHILLERNQFQKAFGEEFFPPRSYSNEKNEIRDFNPDDDLWEVFRFKWDNLNSIEKKWKELKLNESSYNFFLAGNFLKKCIPLEFYNKKTCPKCGFKSRPIFSVNAFSPYSPLGACSSCSGYGANLIFDESKLIDKDLSIRDGGLKILNYGPFHEAYEELLKIVRKKNISTTTALKKLNKDFFRLLKEGEGRYPGFNELIKYLESKRYKPSVRIYIRKLQKEEICTVCNSSRLNKNIHHYKISFKDKKWSLNELMGLRIEEIYSLFCEKSSFESSHKKRLYKDICDKLKVAVDLGLNHLQLLRKTKTLSAGEYQRLLLIKYLSFKGTDSLFILDEPSVGLAKRELDKLINGIREIIRQGNTVIVIDHSNVIQKASDYLVVMGPGSGKAGGEIIYQGPPGPFILKDEYFKKERLSTSLENVSFLEVMGSEIFERKYSDFKVPLNDITWVTGASGTGKTSVIVKVLANKLYKNIHGEFIHDDKFKVDKITNSASFRDIIVVSSDLNKFTSRSSVGTITELASTIRKHFLKLPISKSMNLKEGHLSPNSELGMCSRCEGQGVIVIEMQYLEDIVLECEDCRGQKIKPIYANISDGSMTVAEAYNLPLGHVLERIELTPKFRRVWEYLKILNLDYLSLDRSLNSLSGGEKQRIFLLSKLLKNIETSLLVLENISFGLSNRELKQLGVFLRNLLKSKNTILIIDQSPYFSSLTPWELSFDTKTITLNKNR